MAKRKWGESTPRCCLSLKLQCERIYMPVPPVLARRTRSFIYLRHLALGKGRRQFQEAGPEPLVVTICSTGALEHRKHGTLARSRVFRHVSAQLRVNSPGEFPEKCQQQEFRSVLAKFEGKQARFSEDIPSSVSFSSAASAVHT